MWFDILKASGATMLLVYMLMKMDIIFNVWSGIYIFFFSFFLFMITNCCLLKLFYEESDFKLIFKIVHLLVFMESGIFLSNLLIWLSLSQWIRIMHLFLDNCHFSIWHYQQVYHFGMYLSATPKYHLLVWNSYTDM